VAEETLGVEARWPELFAPLSDEQRRSVVSTLASSWHEGWVPNRDDVADLAALVAGRIGMDEYQRRGIVLAEHVRGEADNGQP
jgi:Antitoxin VbhA